MYFFSDAKLLFLFLTGDSSDDENEILTSPKKTTASPKPSPLSTRKYLGLNLSTVPRSSPPSLPADISDLASITSADIDPASSPGSPRRKVFNHFHIFSQIK